MKLHEMVKTISVDDKIGTKMLNSHSAMFKFQELIPVCKKKNIKQRERTIHFTSSVNE